MNDNSTADNEIHATTLEIGNHNLLQTGSKIWGNSIQNATISSAQTCPTVLDSMSQDTQPKEGDVTGWHPWESIWTSANLNQLEILEHSININPFLLNARNRFGQTPLHVACCSGSIDCIDLLLRRGADFQVREDRHGRIPAGEAIMHLQSRSLKVLADHHAIPESELAVLETQALEKNDQACCEVLQRYAMDKGLQTPHFPPDEKHESAVRKLNETLEANEKVVLESKEHIVSYTSNTAEFVIPNEELTRAPQDWSTSECITWAKEFAGFQGDELDEISQMFNRSKITGEVIMRLGKQVISGLLQRIGVSAKHRVQLMSAISDLRYDDEDDNNAGDTDTEANQAGQEVGQPNSRPRRLQKLTLPIAFGSPYSFQICCLLESVDLQEPLVQLRKRIQKKLPNDVAPNGFVFYHMRKLDVVSDLAEKKHRLIHLGAPPLILLQKPKKRETLEHKPHSET